MSAGTSRTDSLNFTLHGFCKEQKNLLHFNLFTAFWREATLLPPGTGKGVQLYILELELRLRNILSLPPPFWTLHNPWDMASSTSSFSCPGLLCYHPGDSAQPLIASNKYALSFRPTTQRVKTAGGYRRPAPAKDAPGFGFSDPDPLLLSPSSSDLYYRVAARLVSIRMSFPHFFFVFSIPPPLL